MGTENDSFNNLMYKESTSSGGWILCFCDNDYHHPLSCHQSALFQAAFRHIQSLLSLLGIAPVNCVVLENVAASKFGDFEDAVLHEAAGHAGQNLL